MLDSLHGVYQKMKRKSNNGLLHQNAILQTILSEGKQMSKITQPESQLPHHLKPRVTESWTKS